MGTTWICILISFLTAQASVWLTKKRFHCNKIFSSAGKTTTVFLTAAGISVLLGCFLPLRIGFWVNDLRVWILFFCMIGAALTDLDSRTIPNLFSIIELSGAGIVLLMQLIVQKDEAIAWLLSGLIGAAVTFLFLILVRKIAKGGLGFGDIKLLTGMALLIGIYGAIYVMIFAEVSALIVAIVLLIRKKITMRGTVPFAPFFLIGFVITVVLGLL